MKEKKDFQSPLPRRHQISGEKKKRFAATYESDARQNRNEIMTDEACPFSNITATSNT